MYLGIEIGGTKLQLGVGTGDGAPLRELIRRTVDPRRAADGIREQIVEAGRDLIQRHAVTSIGIGFGGPVWADRGMVQKSHQVSGWDQFPLAEWCTSQLHLPTRIGNDCDVACLAEARGGAGRSYRKVFYITIGTGVGGGFVVDGQPYGADRPAVAEIGHLRPGLDCCNPHETVESKAAGPGIANSFRQAVDLLPPEHRLQVESDLAQFYETSMFDANAQHLARAALDSSKSLMVSTLARKAWSTSTITLGWALAQMITLLAADVVVVGGGVSLSPPELFIDPLRQAIDDYVFPPLKNTYQVIPAQLGEEVVVHGALALAAQTQSTNPTPST